MGVLQMYMFSAHYPSLCNIVKHTREVQLASDEIIAETISHHLLILCGQFLSGSTNVYWLEIDEHGYVHAHCDGAVVRNHWFHWGCLPHEELVINAMRDVELLRKSPVLAVRPAPLTGSVAPMQLKDDIGVLCEWTRRSWSHPTRAPVQSLRVSCVFLYAGSDAGTAEASILEYLPLHSNDEHSTLFAVPTVLWFDPHAPWIDTRLLTPRVLRTLPVLRISHDNFREIEDLSDHVVKKRYVTRARKNDALFVPRTALHWRGLVSSDGVSSYGVSYNWRVVLVACPRAYATGTFPPDMLITVLPEELVITKEPCIEQLAHVLDTSWKVTFPRMHFETHIFEDSESSWPLAEYGLMLVDGKVSESAYFRRTRKVGILLHESLIDNAFEGFALESAQVLKKPLLERDLCCICTEAHVNCVVDCGHVFCHSCITRSYEESTSCPACRRTFGEWTCTSTTVRIPTAPRMYDARIAAIVRGSLQYVLLTPCVASQNVVQAWFPTMTVCNLAQSFTIPPYKTRLLITWVPSNDQLEGVHRVIQEFSGEGKCVEAISIDTPLDISKSYYGMSESSTYHTDE